MTATLNVRLFSFFCRFLGAVLASSNGKSLAKQEERSRQTTRGSFNQSRKMSTPLPDDVDHTDSSHQRESRQNTYHACLAARKAISPDDEPSSPEALATPDLLRTVSATLGGHQKYCYLNHSYAFWFGDDVDQDILARRCRCNKAGLDRQVSMATVHSGDEVSLTESMEYDEDSSCGSEYIDDSPCDTPLMLDDYSVFENVKSVNDVVSGIYCDKEDSDLFGKPTSHPEKCIASGPRLYFGQVGAENHFEVSVTVV